MRASASPRQRRVWRRRKASARCLASASRQQRPSLLPCGPRLRASPRLKILPLPTSAEGKTEGEERQGKESEERLQVQPPRWRNWRRTCHNPVPYVLSPYTVATFLLILPFPPSRARKVGRALSDERHAALAACTGALIEALVSLQDAAILLAPSPLRLEPPPPGAPATAWMVAMREEMMKCTQVQRGRESAKGQKCLVTQDEHFQI